MRMNVHPQKRGPGRPATGGRREDILDAALGLFAERGFHGTAIPDIAAAAGVAAGTIYRHFVGKEALVNALYRRSKQQLVDEVLVGLPAPVDTREQFRGLWWRLVEYARRRPVAFDFLELHHHGDYLDEESRALEVRALLPIASFLADASSAGHVRALAPQALMAIVWGAFVGMIKASRQGYLVLTDELCAQIETTCWDAVRGPDSTPAAPPASRDDR
jgi:TetR/AcrR family transcriptional regulator, repressor of fatR-cypB operon